MGSLLDSILERIAAGQSTGGPYYPAGLFPSQRLKKQLHYRREDSNIFFTAIIVHTLQGIREQLSETSQERVDTITERARATYPLYQNRKGLATYNFYQTNPSNHFPNGRFMNRTQHFKLPDDADDTVMIYLTSEKSVSEQWWLKEKLRAHANTVKGWIRTGPEAFRQKKIYSTWFGEQMPIDFDISTLSNILLWVFQEQLPVDEFDTNSLELISYYIQSGEYKKNPLEASAYYATVPLIMYHVGRLMAEAPVLQDCRKTLVNDLYDWLKKPLSFMDQILITTTLRRLGESVSSVIPTHCSVSELERLTEGSYFSIAPLLNYYPQTRWLARWKLSHINWECTAHSLALIAENCVLETRIKRQETRV